MKASYQISVVNDTTQATPTNFQQLIQTTLQYPSGVRFWSPIDGWLYGWLESLSSTNQANIWVKIPSSIPAGGVYQIYMVESSSLNFDGNYWGEAPNLSSSYGQYDNGANVFLNYFSGASLSGWTTAGTAGQTSSAPSGNPTFGTYAFYTNGARGDYLYTTASGQSTNMIIEFYGYTENLQDLFFLVNSSGAGQMIRDGNGDGWYGIASTSSWTSWAGPPDTGYWSNEWVTVGVVVNNGTATGYLAVGVVDYGSEIGSNPSNQYTVANNGNYLGLIGDSANSSSTQYWNGIIIRALPPNGVMPETAIVPLQSWEVFMPPLP